MTVVVNLVATPFEKSRGAKRLVAVARVSSTMLTTLPVMCVVTSVIVASIKVVSFLTHPECGVLEVDKGGRNVAVHFAHSHLHLVLDDFSVRAETITRIVCRIRGQRELVAAKRVCREAMHLLLLRVHRLVRQA